MASHDKITTSTPPSGQKVPDLERRSDDLVGTVEFGDDVDNTQPQTSSNILDHPSSSSLRSDKNYIPPKAGLKSGPSSKSHHPPNRDTPPTSNNDLSHDTRLSTTLTPGGNNVQPASMPATFTPDILNAQPRSRRKSWMNDGVIMIAKNEKIPSEEETIPRDKLGSSWMRDDIDMEKITMPMDTVTQKVPYTGVGAILDHQVDDMYRRDQQVEEVTMPMDSVTQEVPYTGSGGRLDQQVEEVKMSMDPVIQEVPYIGSGSRMEHPSRIMSTYHYENGRNTDEVLEASYNAGQVVFADDTDVVIEGSYVERSKPNEDPPANQDSREDVLFTVTTPVPSQNPSSDSVSTKQSFSSSTAELLQVINSDDIEFDAEQFNGVSSPKDGRSLNYTDMRFGKNETSHKDYQSSDEELRSFVFSPPPSKSKLVMSSEKTLSSKKPILKIRTSFPDMRSSKYDDNDSARNNSKVKFDNEIQMRSIEEADAGLRPQVTDKWENSREENCFLELPEFTDSRPEHLAKTPQPPSNSEPEKVIRPPNRKLSLDSSNKEPEKLFKDHNRRFSLDSSPSSNIFSRLLQKGEKRNHLQTKSLPAYITECDEPQSTARNKSSKSDSDVTEKEVVDFVKQLVDNQTSTSYQESNKGIPATNSSMMSYTTPSLLFSEDNHGENSQERNAQAGESSHHEEVLLRVASTLIRSLDSGIHSDICLVSSLQKLLQDVRLLEKNVPSVASTPVFSSASSLLRKLIHRQNNHKASPSLTATYLKYLNNFEYSGSDDSMKLDADLGMSSDKMLDVYKISPHSAPVVGEEKQLLAKRFNTDTLLQKADREEDSLGSSIDIHEHWDRINSWLSLMERNQPSALPHSNVSSSTQYPASSFNSFQQHTKKKKVPTATLR